MFFLTFEASPKPSPPRYGEIDGAIVSWWANEPAAELAQAGARAMADAHGWDFVELDELREGVREEYLASPDRLELFEQAAIDGLVLTFHTWPVGGSEE